MIRRPLPVSSLVKLSLAAATAAACSSSSPSSAPSSSDGPDAGALPACVGGSLVLSGSSPSTPHGTYQLSHVTLSGASFGASLPNGGSLQLDWNGDATAGPVSITGQLAIPSEDASMPTIWCVDAHSTLRIVAADGQLSLTLGLEGSGLCSATGVPQPNVDLATGCVDVSG